MKKTLLICLISFLALSVRAQTKDSPPSVDLKEPTDSVQSQKSLKDAEPEYPGGVGAFYRYIQDSLRYPEKARRKNIQGKVFLSFVIEKDGSLVDIKVLKGVTSDIDAEAIRLIKECPKWKSGMQNGKPVRVQYSMPINFALQAK
ncbi:MAG: energy transducer TonB [Bacteroidetes bacterium]|nr:energy transducer TonB [Bacteroidota bacterium]